MTRQPKMWAEKRKSELKFPYDQLDHNLSTFALTPCQMNFSSRRGQRKWRLNLGIYFVLETLTGPLQGMVSLTGPATRMAKDANLSGKSIRSNNTINIIKYPQILCDEASSMFHLQIWLVGGDLSLWWPWFLKKRSRYYMVLLRCIKQFWFLIQQLRYTSAPPCCHGTWDW